jgi:hypothetical protein
MSLAVLGVLILAIVAGVLLVLGGLAGWVESRRANDARRRAWRVKR